MIIYPIIGIAIGLAVGYFLPWSFPLVYAKYISVALLAAFDSVFGGVASAYDGKYDNRVFLTGFFSNALLAGLLAYIGERIGIDLYFVALLAFGVRVFQNLAAIRRHIFINIKH